MDKYVIGVDFGTDSVRVACEYTDRCRSCIGGGVLQAMGAGPLLRRQQESVPPAPSDYIEGLTESVTEALAQVPAEVRAQIVGLVSILPVPHRVRWIGQVHLWRCFRNSVTTQTPCLSFGKTIQR